MEENRDDHDGQEQSGDMDASTSQVKSSTKKGRGPSKSVQTITPVFLEFDEFDMSIGKWESAYGKQIGNCAQRVNINVKGYPKYDKVQKQNLWEESKRKFHIDDPKGSKEKKFHEAVGARFRKHKSWLVSRFITKETAPPPDSPSANIKPWELYEGYITEEQWKEFETYCNTDEFKALSEKGKENAKNNKHRHHLGSKSYERARVDWSKTNRIPAESSTSSTTESTTSCVMSEKLRNRSLYWILARQTRNADGSWAIDPKNTETQQIANAIAAMYESGSSGRSFLDQKDRKEAFIGWSAPPMDFFVLNIDGASNGTLGLVGAGAVIRDNRGIFIKGFAAPLGLCSAFEAELAVVEIGLEMAKVMGIQKLHLQLDNQACVEALRIQLPKEGSAVIC